MPVQLDTSTSSGLLGQSVSLPDQIFAVPNSGQDTASSDIKPEDLLLPKSEPVDLGLISQGSDSGQGNSAQYLQYKYIKKNLYFGLLVILLWSFSNTAVYIMMSLGFEQKNV